MSIRLLLAALAGSTLVACGHLRGEPRAAIVEIEEDEAWRDVAEAEDAAALENIPARWRAALVEARRRFKTRVTAAGDLLDPVAGLPRATPGPGPYRCTLYRIGPPARRRPAFSASAESFCFVGLGEEDQLTLTTELPGRRVGGYLYEQKGAPALVFLGTEIARGGSAASYGEEGADHAVGIFERIDELEYRLVLPEAGGGLHVIAMRPAPRQP